MSKIKQCNDCKAEIPRAAKKCMHCGTKQAREYSLGGLLAVLFVGFIVYSCVATTNSPSVTSSPKFTAQIKAEASAANINSEESRASSLCMQTVRGRAKFPSSVDFSAWSSPKNERLAVGGWRIFWAFESKNGFGNTIPQMAQCLVSDDKLISFSTSNR